MTSPRTAPKPVLVMTQGDAAGIGPEILLKVASEPWLLEVCRPLLVIEPAAVESMRGVLDLPWGRLVPRPAQDLKDGPPDGVAWLVSPVGEGSDGRFVQPGAPCPNDARGALSALDLGIDLVCRGVGDALITAPVNKAEIARHVTEEFRGHTDYLAEKAGLTSYGKDYLMAFLTPRLKVALLSTHVSLQEALDRVTEENVLAALRCWHRHAEGRIVVAGLDPHAGEDGLIGTRDRDVVLPAVSRARAEGIDAYGPESADSLFARVIRGAYDWVLALYHDQGLIGVKTASFGDATNWTLGLPYLRTSVDHGTAYDIAGQGVADPSSLRAVITSTLELVAARK